MIGGQSILGTPWKGIEAINMMRKGQVKRLGGKDAAGQAKFVESLFGVAASSKKSKALVRLNTMFATQPRSVTLEDASGVLRS